MHRLQRLTTARPCNSTRQSFSAFRTFTSIVQRQSEHPAPLNSSEQQREHPTPVCRACGVPISASEAGPKSFRETLASMFIVGVSLGWVVAGMMWYYSPTTVHTAGGRRTRDQFQEEWNQKLRKEGDLEQKETPEQREQEKACRERRLSK